MAKASLDQNQIKNLLRQSTQQTAARVPEWPNSEDRKRIHNAAKGHKKSVVLSDGREYLLKYSTRDNSVAWEPYEVVFVSPADSIYVPCGYFRIKSLLVGA